MKIDQVSYSSRKKSFEVVVGSRKLPFPAALLRPPPSREDPLVEVYVDPEIGNEGFTYVLRSGAEDSVHLDHVLHYNRDPDYEHKLRLHCLTVEAQKALAESGISKRALTRRLGTSLSQLARLLDQTNYSKSLEQVLRLLNVLGRDATITLTRRATDHP